MTRTCWPLAAGEPEPRGDGSPPRDCPVCRSRSGSLRGRCRASAIRSRGRDGPGAAGHPLFIGKYFIAGVGPRMTRWYLLAGVHSLVNQDVMVHLCRTPLAANAVARTLIAAGCRTLTRFNDPRVARVFEVDFFDDRPYLVTEALEGRSLETFQTQEPLTPARAAVLVAELARCLEAAHRLGLGHGGLNVQSVLIDDAGRPRLTGFGIARLVDLRTGRPPGPPPRSPGLTSSHSGGCSGISCPRPSRTVPGGQT